MNYRQLTAGFPNLVNRYFPNLSIKDNALAALKAFDADPDGTPEEKRALTEYVGTHAVAADLAYKHSEECGAMVAGEHIACPYCIHPTFPKADPEHGILDDEAVSACKNCLGCCKAHGHTFCKSCKEHIEKACRHCNGCKKCCECKVCPYCNEMQECAPCGCCMEHCSCPAPKPHPIHGKSFPVLKPTEQKLFDCARMAGVEWEYNRLRLGDKYMGYWNKHWFGKQHADASCGMEAITPPVAGDHLVKCITQLGKLLNKSGANIDERCSIHVHVDAKDLKWSDIVRFLGIYAQIEPMLFIIAGQDRITNRYCLPIGKDYAEALKRVDQKDAIMAAAFNAENGGHGGLNQHHFGRNSQRQRPGRRADDHKWARRRALNLLPWLAGRGPRQLTQSSCIVAEGDTVQSIAKKQGVSIAALTRWNKLAPGEALKAGRKLIMFRREIAKDTTIEVRLHPNSSDTNQVLNWTKLCVRIVDWVSSHTDKEAANLPKSSLRMLCNMAPDLQDWIITKVREWKNNYPKSSGGRRLILKGGKWIY